MLRAREPRAPDPQRCISNERPARDKLLPDHKPHHGDAYEQVGQRRHAYRQHDELGHNPPGVHSLPAEHWLVLKARASEVEDSRADEDSRLSVRGGV